MTQPPKQPSWDREPLSPEQKRRNNKIVMRAGVGLLVFFVVVVLPIAIFGADEDSDAEGRVDVTVTDFTSYPPPTAATTFTPPPATTPTLTVANVACEAAPDAYVSAIEMSLIDSSLALENLQSLEAPRGLVYIGADVLRDGERESGQDIWVVKDDVIYALSGSANKLSILPDGRDLLDVNISAGDEYGSALQNCVARVRQGG
ncbi:hypothetical protein [Nocardia sp. 348MFTsu5.1]|uniref:hypothetical protein n=1 Tax=Nocardia sp. 348MFTsu5.1 TaxID=1172185 RepID=UPI0012DFAD7F|nr:hypothetical protein [Nocardia sp. 348MFTsu5.1]